MAVAVRERRKRERLPEVPEATLADVRKALRSRRAFRRAPVPDLLIAILLSTGLLALLQLSVLAAAREHAALTALTQPSIRLSVRDIAEVPEIHAFLQALLQLPPVRGVRYVTREQQFEDVRRQYPEGVEALSGEANPFADRVDVALRSPEDFSALVAFLQRPQLRPILQPQFLWEVPNTGRSMQSDISAHRSMRFLFFLVSVVCLLLLLLSAAQFVRGRLQTKQRHVQTLRLLGADARAIYLPYIGEVSLLLAVSFACSLLLIALFHGAFPYL